MWAAANGPIPQGYSVKHRDGDRDNNDLSNLSLTNDRSRPGTVRRDCRRPIQQFQGVRYYQRDDGYLHASEKSAQRTGHYLMHRAVWAAANGPIPPGVHIHHIDGDKANNRLDNLQPLDGPEHMRLHKSEPTGAAAEDSEQRSRRRQQEWANRKPRKLSCAECGTQFESTGVRARFCSRSCNKRHHYHRTRGRR